MIEFSHPYMLWFLIGIPGLFFVYFTNHRRRKAIIFKNFDKKIYHRLSKFNGKNIRHSHVVLILVSLTLLIAAAAGPRVGTEIRELKREGVDIIIALDLSRSMTAEDIAPNRLQRAKFEIKKFIHTLKGDRIGLVGFAGIANLQ